MNESKCTFCTINVSKYNCPRCGYCYCSSECYRSEAHGSCSQQFYREWVFNYLQNERVDEDTRQKTLEIIKRSAAMDAEEDALGSDDEEDEEDDMAKRFEGIDLEVDELDEATVAEILNRLTDKERSEFEGLVETGEILNLIPGHEFWTPWWTTYKPVLVQEVGAANGNKDSNVPEIAHSIPLLSSLSSKPISPLVRHSIANVLISFCYVCRYFNGEVHKNPHEAIAELLGASSVLREATATFDDSRAAIQASIQYLMTSKSVPVAFAIELLEDTKLIAGKSDIGLRFMSDLLLLVKQVIAEVTEVTEVKVTDSKKNERKKVKLLQKKVQFLLSWMVANGQELANSAVDIEYELLSMKGHERTIRESHSFIRENHVPKERNKVLIEELN